MGKLASPPDYQETQHFFLGGLIGESVIPVGQICAGKGGARQLQSQTTFLNSLIPASIAALGAMIALGGELSFYRAESDSGENLALSGDIALPIRSPLILTGAALMILAPLIYTPKTAKVWCGGKGEDMAGQDSSEKFLEGA